MMVILMGIIKKYLKTDMFEYEMQKFSNPSIIFNDNSTHSSVYTKQPFYIFVHPPKTGGSLIRAVLIKWCEANNRRFSEEWELFLQMNKSQQNEIDLIFGHFPYGIHKSTNFHIVSSRPIKYFTILRDPVRQAVSAFHFRRLKSNQLGGALVLESAIDELNNFLVSATAFSEKERNVQLNNLRNLVISRLLGKDETFVYAVGCLASFGGSEGWRRFHNHTVEKLQKMNSYSLVTFAKDVLNSARNSSCKPNTSQPYLSTSFSQYLNRTPELDPKRNKPAWLFGNNPVSTMFCCYHLWFPNEKTDDDQLRKCPNFRNHETLNCALKTLKIFDLILITEQMELSLQLLEMFLNWTIPYNMKILQENKGINMNKHGSKISSQELILAEKLLNLDRIVYQTAVLKFWSNAHSKNIFLRGTRH